MTGKGALCKSCIRKAYLDRKQGETEALVRVFHGLQCSDTLSISPRGTHSGVRFGYRMIFLRAEVKAASRTEFRWSQGLSDYWILSLQNGVFQNMWNQFSVCFDSSGLALNVSSFCMGWKVYSIFRVYNLLSLHEQMVAPVISKEAVAADGFMALSTLFY